MDSTKFFGQGLTYEDVLLVPNYSDVLPREVDIQSKFSRNIALNVPIVSAAMDTVTESRMAIAIAREGGIGVIHKNMSIEEQSNKVRMVKRSESGMILDPVTLPYTTTISEAEQAMSKYKIGGILVGRQIRPSQVGRHIRPRMPSSPSGGSPPLSRVRQDSSWTKPSDP